MAVEAEGNAQALVAMASFSMKQKGWKKVRSSVPGHSRTEYRLHEPLVQKEELKNVLKRGHHLGIPESLCGLFPRN